MKTIEIDIRIDELTGRIVVAKKCKGYYPKQISHQLELLGIFQMLVQKQQEIVKTLNRKSKVI